MSKIKEQNCIINPRPTHPHKQKCDGANIRLRAVQQVTGSRRSSGVCFAYPHAWLVVPSQLRSFNWSRWSGFRSAIPVLKMRVGTLYSLITVFIPATRLSRTSKKQLSLFSMCPSSILSVKTYHRIQKDCVFQTEDGSGSVLNTLYLLADESSHLEGIQILWFPRFLVSFHFGINKILGAVQMTLMFNLKQGWATLVRQGTILPVLDVSQHTWFKWSAWLIIWLLLLYCHCVILQPAMNSLVSSLAKIKTVVAC